MGLRDAFNSKFMVDHPTRDYYGTRASSGLGAEVRDIRKTVDDLAFVYERGPLTPKAFVYNVASFTAAGIAGKKVSGCPVPAGYEKASRSWTYLAGPKNVIVTAVKPGALGDLIKVVWASAGAAAVSVVGTVVTLTIKNDGSTKPSDLQTLVAADYKLGQLIGITSTDDTAIPNAFVTGGAATTQYLTGGEGRGWGCEIIGVWGHTSGIAFVSAKPGSAAAKYEIEWHNTGTLGVVADRKKIVINYNDGVTTVAQVVAAVLANRNAKEHLSAFPTGDGAGALAGLDGKTMTISTDFGTMVFIGGFAAQITSITSNEITLSLPAAYLTAATTAAMDVRLCMENIGRISAPVT